MGDRRVRVHFVVGADSRYLPVSLASMACKYVREVLMDNINRYFTGFNAAVRPTAGYWKDGLRFIEDIKTHIPQREFRRQSAYKVQVSQKEITVGNTKITIVGAGNVGATTAHIAAGRKLGDIVLLDIVKGLAEGKALDMAEAGPVQGYNGTIVGTTDWSKAEESDIVVITSGLARKPGMSRDDLFAKNVQIVKEVSEKVAKYCPDSIVIVVSNPLDAMVYAAAKVTGFPKKRILGMAGVLDAARFSHFVADGAWRQQRGRARDFDGRARRRYGSAAEIYFGCRHTDNRIARRRDNRPADRADQKGRY